MAAKVEIYTWSTCPFCIRAKQLLRKKGVEFTEYG
ncbi:MAG: glutaredoxin, partial [Rivularia sp. ALOHA_DT_140]|nr:glutaredoxin [Rivularia sp. ALOHA_DT_140]